MRDDDPGARQRGRSARRIRGRSTHRALAGRTIQPPHCAMISSPAGSRANRGEQAVERTAGADGDENHRTVPAYRDSGTAGRERSPLHIDPVGERREQRAADRGGPHPGDVSTYTTWAPCRRVDGREGHRRAGAGGEHHLGPVPADRPATPSATFRSTLAGWRFGGPYANPCSAEGASARRSCRRRSTDREYPPSRPQRQELQQWPPAEHANRIWTRLGGHPLHPPRKRLCGAVRRSRPSPAVVPTPRRPPRAAASGSVAAALERRAKRPEVAGAERPACLADAISAMSTHRNDGQPERQCERESARCAAVGAGDDGCVGGGVELGDAVVGNVLEQGDDPRVRGRRSLSRPRRAPWVHRAPATISAVSPAVAAAETPRAAGRAP